MFNSQLPFGSRKSRAIFNRFTQTLARMMRRKSHKFVEYLNDFWLCGPNFESCKAVLDNLVSLPSTLDFQINWKKEIGPCQKLVFLGIMMDTVSGELSLKPDKLMSAVIQVVIKNGSVHHTTCFHVLQLLFPYAVDYGFAISAEHKPSHKDVLADTMSCLYDPGSLDRLSSMLYLPLTPSFPPQHVVKIPVVTISGPCDTTRQQLQYETKKCLPSWRQALPGAKRRRQALPASATWRHSNHPSVLHAIYVGRRMTVKINSLNLYINHMVMFILVTWNWKKIPLYVT